MRTLENFSQATFGKSTFLQASVDASDLTSEGRGKAARPVTAERRSPWVAVYAAFLTAGWRLVRPELLPFGLPGDLPQDFGAPAGVPSVGKSVTKPLKTFVGISFQDGNGLS